MTAPGSPERLRAQMAAGPDVELRLTVREAASLHLAAEAVLRAISQGEVLTRATGALKRALEKAGARQDDEGNWNYEGARRA